MEQFEEVESIPKRPGIGVGIVCYNEYDEVLFGLRLSSFPGTLQFPGGHLEFGETFQKCAARELLEETGLVRKPEEFKYITTINTIRTEADFHYVGIIMSLFLPKDTEIINVEPTKNEWWKWIKWDEAITRPDLFFPISEIINSGFTEVSQFK